MPVVFGTPRPIADRQVNDLDVNSVSSLGSRLASREEVIWKLVAPDKVQRHYPVRQGIRCPTLVNPRSRSVLGLHVPLAMTATIAKSVEKSSTRPQVHITHGSVKPEFDQKYHSPNRCFSNQVVLSPKHYQKYRL